MGSHNKPIRQALEEVNRDVRNGGSGGDGSGCGCLIAIAVVVVLILIVLGG